MPAVLCPNCGGLYKAVGPNAFQDTSEEMVYMLTHCRLCKTPSRVFLLIDGDPPPVGPDGQEFPEVIVPWIH